MKTKYFSVTEKSLGLEQEKKKFLQELLDEEFNATIDNIIVRWEFNPECTGSYNLIYRL